MATPDTIAPPGGPPDHESAGDNVLPFPPHLTDGDFFAQGYTLVPAEEQGGFLSPGRMARFPLGIAVGAGRAAYAMARHYGGSIVGDVGGPDIRVFDIDGSERIARVTEPDPVTGVDPKEAENEVLIFGLSEMDIGSGLSFHEAKAKLHPDRRIISLTTPGVDLTGKTLSIAEGLHRSLEITAAENIRMVREIAGDNPANPGGVSMGTYITMLMVTRNLAEGDAPPLNVGRVELTSPAIGARNVPEKDKFQELDAADKELIDQATEEFFKHMPGNIWEMIKSHPRKAAECAAVIMAYLLEPHKLPNRGAAIAGNLRSVQQGIEWSDLVNVARAHNVHVLGGEQDPLMRQQLPQWIAVKQAAPDTRIRLLEGYGHAMTIDAPGTVGHLDHMAQESTGPVLAAVA